MIRRQPISTLNTVIIVPFNGKLTGKYIGYTEFISSAQAKALLHYPNLPNYEPMVPWTWSHHIRGHAWLPPEWLTRPWNGFLPEWVQRISLHPFVQWSVGNSRISRQCRPFLSEPLLSETAQGASCSELWSHLWRRHTCSFERTETNRFERKYRNAPDHRKRNAARCSPQGIHRYRRNRDENSSDIPCQYQTLLVCERNFLEPFSQGGDKDTQPRLMEEVLIVYDVTMTDGLWLPLRTQNTLRLN